MMNPIPLPPPFGGLNEQIPIAALEAPFADEMLNFNLTQGGAILRNGDSNYSSISTANNVTLAQLYQYGDSNIFALVYDATATLNRVYNLDSGINVYNTAAAGSGIFYEQFFNNYLFFFSPTVAYAPGFYFDGAAFGAIGYTGTGFSPVGGGNNYKNRNYIVQNNEAAYWYSDRFAITGALTKVDLTSLIVQKTTLLQIVSITLSDQVSAVQLQCFIMANGEIFFYSGSYPDSADWLLVGRGFVGQLSSLYKSVISYQGDALVLSDYGITSLRDLFLKGSEDAINLSVNVRVQNTWTFLITSLRAALVAPSGPFIRGIFGIFDSKNNRIIIHLPVTYDPFIGNSSFAYPGNFFFVYDMNLKAWFYHRSYGSGSLFNDGAFYKNKSLFIWDSSVNRITTIEKEGSTGFTDKSFSNAVDTGYKYGIRSAPVSQGRVYVQKCAGIDVFLKSDLYAETEYYVIRDFGVETSTAQKIPDQGTAFQKPFANIGIEGSYIQYQISGTTSAGKTVGYQLYGTNFWIEPGDSPR